MKATTSKFLLFFSLILPAAPSWSQLHIIGRLPGAIGIPVFGEGLSMELPPMATDLIDGNLQAVPIAALLVQPEFVGVLLQEPQDTFTTVSGLGISLAGFTVPALGLLLGNPAELPEYILSGSPILGDAVSLVPGVPILSAPLQL